jgi:hypothetical protein
MILQRSDLLGATYNLASKNWWFGLTSAVGAGFSIYKHGQDLFMIVQLVLSIILSVTFIICFGKLVKNPKSNMKMIRNFTDMVSILFSAFFLFYYGFYHGYRIFSDFHWSELIFTFIGIGLASATFQNASGFNVLLQNLTKFRNTESFEVSEAEWNALSTKYNFKE